MRLRYVLSLAAALAAGAVFAVPARAERIMLRNGHDIKECWIIEETKAQIVVAVIRRGNIGKITLDPADVETIDRTRETTLEEALAKARAALEEEQKRIAAERAAAAAAVTGTAAAGDGTPGGAKGAGGSGDKSFVSDLIPPLTPEEATKIDELVQTIGDIRRAGSAVQRRESALKELVQFGIKAIPACAKALEDDVSYRRMNGARALADISAQDQRLELYQDAIPKLIKLLYDPQPWVRNSANKALEAISAASMGFPEPKGEDLQPEELAAIDRWGKWWDEKRPMLTTK